MKKILFLAAAFLLISLSSCKFVSQKANEVMGTETLDQLSTYEHIQDILKDIEPEWKVYRFSVNNKGPRSQCSNNLGTVLVEMINKDEHRISQLLYPDKNAPTDPLGKSPDFADMPQFNFTADGAMKNIDDCKNMIPKDFKFLNVEYYCIDISEDKKGFKTDITINVQEIGKEKVTAGGVTSSVYYSLRFIISPDGKIRMTEK